ncbi:hypothetical protein RHMOL_Rhmol01G0275500 [Rhododendron molle]|uniref:Uncharacterized protein n=1 Tax=Rhododendron molle TaxID=49168 RepID=A0ACC0Q5U7_RHOML|nr:hypothetical protein RHMOL_Rhmol01G0275500 [Rhododendron molle]
MKLQAAVALACLICLTWIQQIICDIFPPLEDEVSNTSKMNKWTCTCSSAYQGNQGFPIETNCSSSRDCSPGTPTIPSRIITL